MKIMRLLTICALVFALAVCSVPLANAVVSPENKSTLTEEEISQEMAYANRLSVTIDKQYSNDVIEISDFPELEDKIVSVDNNAPTNYQKIIGITLNTTTRAELIECIALVENNEKVYRVYPHYYTPVFTGDSLQIVSGDVTSYTPFLTAEDALIILHLSVGKMKPTIRESFFADMDGDEEITSSDALLALQTAVQLIPETGDCFARWKKYIRNVYTPTDLLYPDEPEFMLLQH